MSSFKIISGPNRCSVQSVLSTSLSSINYWDCCIWTHLIVAPVSVSICNFCKQQLYWNQELAAITQSLTFYLPAHVMAPKFSPLQQLHLSLCRIEKILLCVWIVGGRDRIIGISWQPLPGPATLLPLPPEPFHLDFCARSTNSVLSEPCRQGRQIIAVSYFSQNKDPLSIQSHSGAEFKIHPLSGEFEGMEELLLIPNYAGADGLIFSPTLAWCLSLGWIQKWNGNHAENSMKRFATKTLMFHNFTYLTTQSLLPVLARGLNASASRRLKLPVFMRVCVWAWVVDGKSRHCQDALV